MNHNSPYPEYKPEFYETMTDDQLRRFILDCNHQLVGEVPSLLDLRQEIRWASNELHKRRWRKEPWYLRVLNWAFGEKS